MNKYEWKMGKDSYLYRGVEVFKKKGKYTAKITNSNVPENPVTFDIKEGNIAKTKEAIDNALEYNYNDDQIKKLLQGPPAISINDIPVPSIRYMEHERVCFGGFAETHVCDYFYDGKIYKVRTKSQQFGQEHKPSQHRFVFWYDLRPYQQDVDNIPQLTEKDSIQVSYSQRDIYGLLNTFFSGWVDVDPIYQRGNVWDLEDKQKLIDSIFRNIDIGKFVFIKGDYGDEKLYEVLDGKQRLNAIHNFYLGYFKYKGKTFHELHPKDRAHFTNYSISYGEVSVYQHNENGKYRLTDKQKYEQFLKLNTGGKPQDPRHIEYVKHLWEKENKNECN